MADQTNGNSDSTGNKQNVESSEDRSTRLLEGAYAIKTVRDNIEYYRDFADIYDTQFADGSGYIYPTMLAEVFMRHRTGSDSPIADIGCGTGLVAAALHARETEQMRDPATVRSLDIDGIDISQEMLAVAQSKNLYRALHQADLTQNPKLPDNYATVLSAGTFTFGHLGPDILPKLLQLGRTDTLYCIGVNSVHYKAQGFPKILDRMVEKKLISPPVKEIKKIFDQPNTTDNSHADDTASVLVYRQL